MTRRTRRLSSLVALALVVALVGSACGKNAEANESSRLVNNERSNRRIHPMTMDATLVNKAQAWAEHMAATGRVSHSNLRDGAPGFRYLGENVGWARSVGEMHSLFMSSASHRNSILSGQYSKFGTGVAISNGRVYVVQVFGG